MDLMTVEEAIGLLCGEDCPLCGRTNNNATLARMLPSDTNDIKIGPLEEWDCITRKAVSRWKGIVPPERVKQIRKIAELKGK